MINIVEHLIKKLESFGKKRVPKEIFNPEWERVLYQNWDAWRRFSASTKTQLKNDILIFLEDKKFEGCAGFEITDEVKLLVAAQATLLNIGRSTDHYPGLRNILIYPATYRAKVRAMTPHGIMNEGSQWRSGEAWSRGQIVLAWTEVVSGAKDAGDGRNLVYHEFAHQIDTDLGITRQTEAWCEQRVKPGNNWILSFSDEWMNFLERTQNRTETLIDEYGAQNVAEFFAVTSELFIEKPSQLKQKYPRLFSLMCELYQFNPETL